MNILITGGAGFIGNELVKQLQPNVKKIIIYSRSESRQAKMKQTFPEGGDSGMRYMIGDIRDEDRLTRAMRGVDAVIHAAALKRVEVCEYDPCEAIKTNVVGSMNVVNACINTGVKRCLMISTDKAVESMTCYGSTKATMERLAIGANNLGDCRLSCVRYANVEGSTGSVLEIWKKQLDNHEPLTVTHKDMTRMWITKEEAAGFVIESLIKMGGGEIFIPKCEKRSIISMVQEVCGGFCTGDQFKEIGLRPNEKLHEELVSESDARNCFKQKGGSYIIYPAQFDWRKDWEFIGEKVPEDFRYSSKEALDG